ncbi:MAG: hypothetical protein EXS25_12045 [Pedosphaera sp.]|nr:hypothetical protein [Pedosphaera sp.]
MTPNHALQRTAAGRYCSQSTRLVAAVAELGSLGRFTRMATHSTSSFRLLIGGCATLLLLFWIGFVPDTLPGIIVSPRSFAECHAHSRVRVSVCSRYRAARRRTVSRFGSAASCFRAGFAVSHAGLFVDHRGIFPMMSTQRPTINGVLLGSGAKPATTPLVEQARE